MSVTADRATACAGCGTVNEIGAARFRALEEQVERQREDIGLLERDLRSKRAQIKRLRADQDQHTRADPHYDEAMDVLAYWKGSCHPAAKELGGKRLEHCLARLHGQYTPEALKRAVDGYALKPFVVGGRRSHEGPKDEWHADAELIFRTPEKVDQGIRIADRADDLRNVMRTPETGPESAQEPAGAALSALGASALRMAGFGFYVLPCVQGEKRPATPNGLKDAKRDQQAIAAYWAARPHANVAVRTGRESGIVVLDVDGDEGWDSLHQLEDRHGELPTTLSVRTPGDGEHLYFTHPGVQIANTAGFPGPALDIRGDGGYVLAPPSVGTGGRRYEVDEAAAPAPMPDWLLDMLKAHKKAADVTGKRDWAQFVRNAPNQGERDTRLTSFVGHLFAHGHDAGEVMELVLVLNSHAKPPLPVGDLERMVKSIGAREAAR
jgi:hypothetical protein